MKRFLLKPLAVLILLLIGAELILQAGAAFTRWRYQQDILPFQPAAATRILCLGDSNTYGIYLPREQSWPSQLQGLLDRQAPGQYQIINLGLPGTPAFRILENLPALLAQVQPDQLIVLAGVNDLLFGTIDASAEADVRQRLQRFGINHLRLVRLFRLWQARRTLPDIVTDSDVLQSALEQFPNLTQEESVQQLAALYDPFLTYSNIGVTQEGSDFWLSHGAHRVHLNPIAARMQATPSIYERYRLHASALLALVSLAPDSIRIEHDGRLDVDGRSFGLAAAAIGVQDERHTSMKTHNMRKNIAGIADTADRHGIPLLLLSYASNEHFYGGSNRLLRITAEETGIPFIDMVPVVSAHCPDKACATLFFPDYHPNAEGYRLMAARIADHLLQTRP